MKYKLHNIIYFYIWGSLKFKLRFCFMNQNEDWDIFVEIWKCDKKYIFKWTLWTIVWNLAINRKRIWQLRNSVFLINLSKLTTVFEVFVCLPTFSFWWRNELKESSNRYKIHSKSLFFLVSTKLCSYWELKCPPTENVLNSHFRYKESISGRYMKVYSL